MIYKAQPPRYCTRSFQKVQAPCGCSGTEFFTTEYLNISSTHIITKWRNCRASPELIAKTRVIECHYSRALMNQPTRIAYHAL